VASGVLGFIVPAYFGWTLYISHIPQNIATWGMVFVLDTLGLVLAYKDGNKKPYMQLGWAFAAACIFAAIVSSGNQVDWGWTETIAVILCGIAIILWITESARVAQWAYMAAMYISFVPQAVDFWNVPQPDTLWLWLMSLATCLLAILGAEKRNFANTFVPWGAGILNLIITVLCLI
jgi:hypothetical protein